ncbi:MAG: septum formation initiator family protein [Desulfatitalea sp.]|nr:septum formation initiator family protein [Desulfatitalea sp.]NNK02830.1 septum formation initiator family protein [Desulfatitalea sp.]
MSRWFKIKLGATAAVMFCLLMVIIFGDNGLVELRRMQTTHKTLVKRNDRLNQKILKMYRAIDRLQTDPAFIESVARKELGMVRSDEIIFQFESDVAKKQ